MDWSQIAKGWKQLIAKAFPRGVAQKIDSQADRSILAALSGDGYDEGRITPYIPDDRCERNDSSLHLSC